MSDGNVEDRLANWWFCIDVYKEVVEGSGRGGADACRDAKLLLYILMKCYVIAQENGTRPYI